jgi:hypothetical protein
MFSTSIQGLLAEAHIEELHRTAQTPGRRSAIASAGTGDTEAVLPATLIKRVLDRVLDRGLPRGDDAAAIHGVQFVGHSPATSRGRQS